MKGDALCSSTKKQFQSVKKGKTLSNIFPRKRRKKNSRLPNLKEPRFIIFEIRIKPTTRKLKAPNSALNRIRQ